MQELSCPNSCNGRGNCSQGFCHCLKGYFGRDCSRSKAYHAPLLGTDHPVPFGQLRVYIYELPWQVAFEHGTNLHYTEHDPNYSAYQYFYPILSNDWAVRTEDPW